MHQNSGSEGLDFTARVIALFQQIHPLDQIPRAGYVLRGVPGPESVAAHSHFVSLLALLVLEEHPSGFDREKTLAMALVHDLPEARLMDIPMPSADAYLGGAKQRAEQAIIEDLFEGFPARFADLHREFNEAKTPEARLLRGLDKAQMMLKILCYEREHRGCLDEFWDNPRNFDDYGIEPVSSLFDTICAKAGKARPK
jgi:putative hydrolase of HD superfamily